MTDSLATPIISRNKRQDFIDSQPPGPPKNPCQLPTHLGEFGKMTLKILKFLKQNW